MANIRVYELAKQLGVESKVLLSLLKEMGEFVRSAASPIELPVERRVRERLGSSPVSRERPRLPGHHQPGCPHAHEEHELLGFPLPQTAPRKSASRPGARYGGPRKRQEKQTPLNEWARLCFEDSDRQEWARVGVYDPHMAQECIAKGLGPEQLRDRVEGRRIGERLASGERLSLVLAIREEERRRRAI